MGESATVIKHEETGGIGVAELAQENQLNVFIPAGWF